jgi:hypothetical protein
MKQNDTGLLNFMKQILNDVLIFFISLNHENSYL